MQKPKLVKNVELDLCKAEVILDGESFPYVIADEGVSIYPGTGGVSRLSVDILVLGDVVVRGRE